MPSRVGYNPAQDWLRRFLRKLRIPIVFALSAFLSYCGFQEAGILNGNGGMGPASDDGGRLHATLWNADLMGKGQPLAALPDSVSSFADDLRPDILVVYRVPDFETLKLLRDRLGLYGYTAVMSNFTCGGKAGAFRWPIEIAILSRFPIDEATEYDPAPESLADCPNRGPLTDGPVRASHKRMVVPAEMHLSWPAVRTATGKVPRPGPGFLTAVISARRVAVVAVKAATGRGYPSAGPQALVAMRDAVAAAAGGWVWTQKSLHHDYQFLMLGDFTAKADDGPQLARTLALPDSADPQDGVTALLTQGVIGSDLRQGPGLANGLRMLDLTLPLVVSGVGPGPAPHSDRIYLWSENPGSFGPATRAMNAYGSRAYPISVQSSGATCAIDPFLQWRRNGGIAHQTFAAMKHAVERQLAAMHAAGDRGKWVVVLKLDDVIADDTPLLYRFARKCQLPTQQDWEDWIAKGEAPLMPGAASFIAKVRALAAGGGGRIVILTSRRSDKAEATQAYLREKFPDAPELFDVRYGMTNDSDQAAYGEIASGGARILAVIGSHVGQFPADPKLPVGGTNKSCPLPPDDEGSHVFGPQTARFGVCYALIPEAVE